MTDWEELAVRSKKEVRDLRVACRKLYDAGALDEEVDEILTRPLPTETDLLWACQSLSMLRKARGE